MLCNIQHFICTIGEKAGIIGTLVNLHDTALPCDRAYLLPFKPSNVSLMNAAMYLLTACNRTSVSLAS